MNTVLLLKLLLVPALIAAVTLAGRRWGPGVAGWLSAFPVVAGPILWFIALEQGADFAATAAVGTLSAVLGMLAFGLSYAWAATRFPWMLSLPLAYTGYAATVLLLDWWHASLLPAALAVLIGLWLAPQCYPHIAAAPASAAKPPCDMLMRMALGAALVLLVTDFAARMGPTLSGILAMFPVMGTVLVLFTHRSAGAAAAVQLLRGMVLGFYAFAAFCALLAWLLPMLGTGGAFVSALTGAAIVQALSRLRLHRHAAARR